MHSRFTATYSRLWVFVTSRGVALPESTKVVLILPGSAEQATRHAYEDADYAPATLRGCDVNFWLEVWVMVLNTRQMPYEPSLPNMRVKLAGLTC